MSKDPGTVSTHTQTEGKAARLRFVDVEPILLLVAVDVLFDDPTTTDTTLAAKISDAADNLDVIVPTLELRATINRARLLASRF